MTLQNSLGFFEISNPEIASLIRSLNGLSIVSGVALKQRVLHATKEPYEQVIDYLVEEIGMIAGVHQSVERPLFATQSVRLRDIAKPILGDCAEISTADELERSRIGNRAVTLAFDGNFASAAFDQFLEIMDDSTRLSVLFQVRDVLIISAPWLLSSMTPCPLCVLDYANDKVLFNASDTGMALCDVADLLNANGIYQPPSIPLRNCDLAFGLSLVPEIWDVIASRHHLRNAALDPHASFVVDTDAKRWSAVRVPFSPLCACARQPHQRAEPKEATHA